MATKLKAVDAVIVGMGWTGSIMARELTKAGLNVVGLERGDRVPSEDFALPGIRDELKYRLRFQLMLDNSVETLTMRHTPDELAVPMRRWGAFPLGDGVGGAGTHWNGVTWRTIPSELRLRSHLTERYGRNAIPADLTIQDFGVSYDELEPHFDRFEKLCGTSGKAGNLRGVKQDGGNPFEAARQRISEQADDHVAGRTDLHRGREKAGQAPLPDAVLEQQRGLHQSRRNDARRLPILRPLRIFRLRVQLEGEPEHLHHAGAAAGYAIRAAHPCLCQQPELRPPAKKVSGVTYIDRRTGEEMEQPADMVVLCAYPFNNTLLLYRRHRQALRSGTGKGVVGKNYCHQTKSGVTMFVEDEINPFIGTGVARRDRRFPGRQFRSRRPRLLRRRLHLSDGQRRPPDPGACRSARHAALGLGMEEGDPRWYNHTFPINAHGINYAHRNNYLDLDPTYKDAIGRPLMRMTFNYSDNDCKMSVFLTNKAMEIARAANAKVVGNPNPRRGNFDNICGQSSHHTGGAIMGTDPRTSVVNRYLQNWDASNLFVMGGAAFPQNPGYNPTGTFGALAYWSAEAITSQYLKSPGPLVPA